MVFQGTVGQLLTLVSVFNEVARNSVSSSLSILSSTACQGFGLRLLLHNYITRWLPDSDIILAFKDRIKGKDRRARISPELPSHTTSDFLSDLSHRHPWLKEWLQTVSCFPTLPGRCIKDTRLQSDSLQPSKSPSHFLWLSHLHNNFLSFLLVPLVAPHNCYRTSLFSILSDKSRYNNT